MASHKTLILEKKDVARLIDVKGAIKAIEAVFREYGQGRTEMPPKLYLHLDRYGGDFRAMPAYIERKEKSALKWVNVHPKNIRLGLPTVMAVIILSDPRNGLPLCVMEGTYATSLRTAGAGAAAAKYLARKDSRVAAMVGCGVQARTQLPALLHVLDIKEARVWGHNRKVIKEFIFDMKGTKIKLIPSACIKECVSESDIIVTTTPSRKPLVKLEWLKKGVHINAIGADAKGKQELDPRILKKAKIVVDSREQASHSGEINVPLRKGAISKHDIYADIGEIVAGKKKGRANSYEITVFDSTGLAIQDAAIADLIYKTAVKKGIGKWAGFV